MKHSLIPIGYESLDEVINKINNYDKEYFNVFLNCFSKEMERQAVYDNYKNYKKLASLGFKIYNTLSVVEKNRIIDEDFQEIRLFSHQVSFLRYDSIQYLFENIKKNEYKKEIRTVKETLEELYKISEKYIND